MSRRLSLTSTAAAALLLPSVAHAHGEQILLVPAGQLISLVAVCVFAARKISGNRVAFLAVIAAALASVGFWLIPHPALLWLSYSDTGIFLVGLLPPLLAASGVVVFSRWLGRNRGRA
jgi:hypothetical protein